LLFAPYGSQGLNRYSYVWNNPLRWIDPSGFAPQDACAGNPYCTEVRADRKDPPGEKPPVLTGPPPTPGPQHPPSGPGRPSEFRDPYEGATETHSSGAEVKTTPAEEGGGFNIARGIGDGVKDALWGLASGIGFSLKLATAFFGASWDEETFNEMFQNIAQFPDQVTDLYQGWNNFSTYEKARTSTALIMGLGMLVVDRKVPHPRSL
jgi:hypothetical protein